MILNEQGEVRHTGPNMVDAEETKIIRMTTEDGYERPKRESYGSVHKTYFQMSCKIQVEP